MADSYRSIGSFSAILGGRLVAAMEAGGVRFEAGLDRRLPTVNDHRHLGSEVEIFVHEQDFAAAHRILGEQGLKEGRDFFLQPEPGFEQFS